MIEVIDWKENEDGSADVTFKMSEEERDIFAQIGILAAIKEAMKWEGILDE